MVEHFHGKEGVRGSIPRLGSINKVSLPVMKRLTLNQSDKKLTGLCGGVAAYFDVDSTVVRLIVLTIIIMSGVFPGLLLYLLAAVITPKGDN